MDYLENTMEALVFDILIIQENGFAPTTKCIVPLMLNLFVGFWAKMQLVMSDIKDKH